MTTENPSTCAVEGINSFQIFRPGCGDITAEIRQFATEQTFKDAADDLVSFWTQAEGACVHPSDVQQIGAPNFAIDLLPVPWAGPLRSAKVYLLFLNPGLSDDDRAEEAKPAFKAALQANLLGDAPYPYLLSEHSSHPGYRWARKTFGSDITEAAADQICMLQLVPYHSKAGAVASRVAPRLPSSQAIRRFVREGLLPRVRAGRAGLIVARSSKAWEVQFEENNVIVYRGAESRRAFQTKASRGGALLRRFL